MSPRVCLLTLSKIADDPRVRRHGDSLMAAGYDVVGVGASGARSAPPAWPVHELEVAPLRDSPMTRVLRLPRARLGASQAVRAYWSSEVNQRIWDQVHDIRAEIYVANDWPVLPVAARLATDYKARYVYDTHEYAVEEHADRLLWRLFYPPLVHGLEQTFAPAAAKVLTVSDGIAARLKDDLGLSSNPAVVRNVPHYRAMRFRPVTGDVEVLYQGVLAPDRGIESLIASAGAWREGRRLVIRGIGDAEYVEALHRLDRSEGRIRFEPPGRPHELVDLAHRSDVGIHPITGTTAQIRYALPNKFFEYLMAGLALCVSDMPEMSRLIDEFEVGVKISRPDPDAIAAAVNGLEADQVNDYKRRALETSRVLSWENEESRLLAVFEDALQS